MLQLPVFRSQGHVCSHAHCVWQFGPYQPMGHSREGRTKRSVVVKAVGAAGFCVLTWLAPAACKNQTSRELPLFYVTEELL